MFHDVNFGVCVGGGGGGTAGVWPETLKFDRATWLFLDFDRETWPFLKFDRATSPLVTGTLVQII